MSERRVLVIEPVVYEVERQGAEEVMRAWADEPAQHVRPALDGTDFGQIDYADLLGVVVLGSAASVNDASDWLEALEAWLRPLLTGEVVLPVLGICYGHQLLAKLYGGRVGYLREDHSKRLGVEESVFHGSRLLPDDTALRVVVSHREAVVEPPAELEIVAQRPGVTYDGLQHPRLPVHTVQFHPEARDQFAARVTIPTEAVDARVWEDGYRYLRAFRDAAMRFHAA